MSLTLLPKWRSDTDGGKAISVGLEKNTMMQVLNLKGNKIEDDKEFLAKVEQFRALHVWTRVVHRTVGGPFEEGAAVEDRRRSAVRSSV